MQAHFKCDPLPSTFKVVLTTPLPTASPASINAVWDRVLFG